MWILNNIQNIIGQYKNGVPGSVKFEWQVQEVEKVPLDEEWREPPPSPPFTTRKDRMSENFDIDFELCGFAGKLQGFEIYHLRKKYYNTLTYRLQTLRIVYKYVAKLGPLTESYKEIFIYDEILDTWLWYYYQFSYMFREIVKEAPSGHTIPDIKEQLKNSMETLTLLFQIRYELSCLCHQFLSLEKTPRQKRVERFVYRRMKDTRKTILDTILQEVDRCMSYKEQFFVFTGKSPIKMINCINKHRNEVDGSALDRIIEFRDELFRFYPFHMVVKVPKPRMDFQEFEISILNVKRLVDI